MLIGVIADTHGWLDPAVLEHFRDADLILVAGDIGAAEILEVLAGIAPVHAVRGNNDERTDCRDLPSLIHLEAAGLRIGLSHYEREAMVASDIAVFGHSHRQVWDPSGPVARLNPGAAGRRGFHTRRSVALLEIHPNRSPRATHIDLGARSAASPRQPLC
jgi:putative phosphoesterase